MSEKQARTLTHLSNRARDRAKLERKVVHKTTLENPFRIQWPAVPPNVQNALLARLLAVLGDSEFFRARNEDNRQRKRARRKEIREQATGKAPAEASDVTAAPTTSDPKPISPKRIPPEIYKHLVVGINEVTKRLESQVKHSRHIVTITEEGTSVASAAKSNLRVVFVCRSDVDPPLLISHLPHLVAAFNSALPSQSSSPPTEPVLLVPLPKGAEHTLSEAIGLRRVAVLSIDCDASQLPEFSELFASVPIVTASWLAQTKQPARTFIQTHIRRVQTTAPKDMRASKELRVAGRKAAKRRKLDELISG